MAHALVTKDFTLFMILFWVHSDSVASNYPYFAFDLSESDL